MGHAADRQFTFRAPEQDPEDLERCSGAWTPDTATAADGYSSDGSAYDACARQGSHSEQGYGAVHYHHHVHHHHYHTAPRHLHRSRHLHADPAAADTPLASTPSLLPQDPLTWMSAPAAAAMSGGGMSAEERAHEGASSAWMAELLDAHGVGQEWTQAAAETEVARRWSQRRHTFASSVPPDDDDASGRYNPHWDDMLTFRQTRVPRERAWSGSDASADRAAAAIAAAADPARGKGWRLLPMATHAAGRSLCLTVLPVAVVVLWCSVPLRTDRVVPDDPSSPDDPQEKLNFWFFLLFYYGLYNAVALTLVTQIFHVYSLTWWPRSMSGLAANVTSWMFSMLLGALVYLLDTGIERDPLTWTALTLLTLLLPVAVSFAIIQRHHRRSVRQRHGWPAASAASADDPRRHLLRPLIATSVEWRTPASYRRFLWFCSSFLLWYAALAAGEYLAYVYIDTLPHTTKDGFYYVYSWIATVNVLSAAASWVVTTKIRSWPLQYIYSLYFFTTYFIFYRNLFARLQNPEQVVLLQLGSSMWVVLIYPLRMARPVFRALAFVLRWSDDYTYDTYVRQLGRTFFLRNKAENATMLGFICWVSVLHFGPNSRHYPYFRFEPKDDEFNYEYSLTIRASVYVWASELLASRVVRFIFRHVYALDVGAEAVSDFRRYPHVVPVLVLVTVHVLQNILFGMIRLDFA
ncbi:hypothetical protein EV175_001792 [Coemansia sp. RSA 1933]|nr:hypothetical protein EV175_001792 [Coemansia sp. RSA 1933]